MKLACMLGSLGRSIQDGTLTVPKALSLIRELGGQGVDMSARYIQGRPHAEVRRMAEDAGLAVSCHIAGANLAVAQPAQRTAAIDTVRRAIDDACGIGAGMMLATTGTCPEGMSKAEARRLVAAGLSELLPHARAAGVTLTIEDSGSAKAPHRLGAEVLECCQLAGPELRITYDTGNTVIGDEDPVAALEVMRPRVVYAHAKDWELLPEGAETPLVSPSGKRYVGTVVGRGVIDYPAVFAALRGMGYNGFLSFEYEGRGDPVAAAREGMAYLRERIEA